MKRVTTFAIIFIMLFSIPLIAKPKVRMGVILAEQRDENYGVIIKKVTAESPAEKAGLIADDLLMKIDGDKIYTVGQVRKMLELYEPDQKIKISYMREDQMNSCMLQLVEKKGIELPKRTYMGVFMDDMNEKLKEKLKFEEPFGIYISEVVKDSPADKAGLKAKDVLLTFADEKIYTSDQLIKMLKNFKPEDEVELKVHRGKKTKNLKIILGEKEDTEKLYFSGGSILDHLYQSPDNILFYQYDYSDNKKWIGVELDIKKEKKVEDGETTVNVERQISKVIEGTPAEKAGLKKGDIIIAVENDENMEISQALKDKEIGDEITLTIERDGKVREFNVGIAERESPETVKDVEFSIDNGEIKVLIDGTEKKLEDLEKLKDGFGEIKVIKDINIEALDDVKDKLNDARKKMGDIDLDIEILNDHREL